MTGPGGWNAKVIEEFRANEGRVGGPFEGAPLLLLNSTGAKSGQTRVNPMMYQADDDRLVVFASKQGAPTNPDWYHNLLANPEAVVAINGVEIPVTAALVTGPERDTGLARFLAYPMYQAYRTRTDRELRLFALTPR